MDAAPEENLASVLCPVCRHLRIVRNPGPISAEERHRGQGYLVIDDIYSPACHATITRTGYLDA
jgi:hypothetical protein